jgi:hypothetical protein
VLTSQIVRGDDSLSDSSTSGSTLACPSIRLPSRDTPPLRAEKSTAGLVVVAWTLDVLIRRIHSPVPLSSQYRPSDCRSA